MSVFIGALSLGAISNIINSISTLSLNIYSLTTNIQLSKNIYHQEIKNILIKTDLEATIKLLHTIIVEIPQYYNDNESVIIALQNMQEIIGHIEQILFGINTKIGYNNNIYIMRNIRSYNFKNDLNDLENFVAVLEKRRDNLFKTLELFKNTAKNNIPNKKLLTIACIDNNNYDKEEDSSVI
jgi:hypothetical protein